MKIENNRLNSVISPVNGKMYTRAHSAQGSVVGPVSYNIFSNDLFLILDDNVHVYNYADDNSYMCAGYDYIETQQCLMQNVEKVIAWYEENNMKVNPDKFKYIVLVSTIMLIVYLSKI